MPSLDQIKAKPLRDQYDVMVDSIFGFGFTGAPRPPFDVIIEVISVMPPAFQHVSNILSTYTMQYTVCLHKWGCIIKHEY